MEKLVKTELYADCMDKLDALLEGIDDPVAIMSTLNGVLKQHVPYFFWVGFYLLRGDELIVGPYQGTVGCLRIAIGRGVCGTAAQRLETVVVPDTSAFPGHIACDPNSKSEIVVPVLDAKGNLYGVWDVDSKSQNSFDDVDRKNLETMVTRFLTPALILPVP